MPVDTARVDSTWRALLVLKLQGHERVLTPDDTREHARFLIANGLHGSAWNVLTGQRYGYPILEDDTP